MTAELNARGHACAVNTVAALMKTHGIRAKTVRRFVRTTDSRHSLPVAGNVLDRQFQPVRPNTAWSADITYIPTADGWLYLAVVEDLFSRRIVGWSMDATMTSRLVVDALDMALGRRVPEEGLLAHSGRGSQYASEHYQRLLAEKGITCSMSGVAQCWDNAPVESFFASLKRELVHHERYTTREEAKATACRRSSFQKSIPTPFAAERPGSPAGRAAETYASPKSLRPAPSGATAGSARSF